MPIDNQKIELRQGNSHSISIQITNEGANLTGATARWWMAQANARTAAVPIKKSTVPAEGGGLAIANVSGVWTLQITINPADTENLTTSSGWYHEAEVTEANGKVSTVATGSAVVKQTIVRP